MAKVAVRCCACGTVFFLFPKDAKRSEHHFCCRQCQSTPCIPRKCQECGKIFYVTGYNYSQVKFCSDECRNARNRREQTHKKQPQVELICERCGNPFHVRHSIARFQRYCSQKCSGEAIGERNSGANSPTWKGKITITCAYCGKEFQTFPSRQGRRRYCCREHSILGNLQRLAEGQRTDIEIAMGAALSKAKLDMKNK